MVKTSEKEKWQPIDEKGYVDEKELQKMLADSPDLIPVEELGGDRKPIKVAVREAGLKGSGSTDLIGIDEYGNITIVETKLANNQEIKREVIGQILEYAAYLWQKTYEEFDEIIYRKLNSYLLDLMQKEMEKDDEWSVKDFRDAIETNLKNGTFTLFIVVDAINEELRRIIDYFNSKNLSGFSFHALELKYFQEKGMAVVLPQLYGVANRLSSRKQPAIQWDEESYFMNARENISDKRTLDLLLDVYAFSKENADGIRFGKGNLGKILFELNYHEAENATVPIFHLKANGTIKINFWGIANAISNGGGEAISRALYKKLSALPVIKTWYRQTEKDIMDGRRPAKELVGRNLPINEVFPDESSLKIFKAAILDLKKELNAP